MKANAAAMARLVVISLLAAGVAKALADGPATQPASAEWPCWRGPDYNGVVPAGPKLLDSWPREGPQLLWRSGFIPSSAHYCGMGQPAVAEGKVFLYLPWRHPTDGGDGSKGYVPITAQRLRDYGYIEDMPEDLERKIEEARVSPKKPKVIDHYSLSFTAPEEEQIEKATKIIKESPGLEAYINDFVATLDPKDVEKYGAYIRMRVCHYGSSDGKDSHMVSWEQVKKLKVLKGEVFPSAAFFGNECGRRHMYDGFGGATGWSADAWNRASSKVVDTVLCLDAATGKEIWRKEMPFDGKGGYPEFGGAATVAVAGGRCYAAGLMGLYCLSAKDGALLWQAKGNVGHASPLVADGIVYYPEGGAAYDAETGRLLWKAGGSGRSSPILWTSGGTKFIICGNACLDLRAGTVKWTAKWSMAGGFTPTISGDVLVAANGAYKLTPEKAELLWKMPAGVADEAACPVVCQDHLYWMHNWYDNPVWHCVDMKTGEVKWKQKPVWPGDTCCSSAVLADGKLIHPVGLAHALDHYALELLKATPDKYTLLGAFNPEMCPMSSPAVAGGKLYVRLWDGVVCYDLEHCAPLVRKVAGNTITLRLERPVDRDVWKSEKSYAVSGAKVTKVEVDEAEPCQVRLVTDKDWKVGDKTTIKCPALSAQQPERTVETACTLVPGRPVVDSYFQECLVGEYRPGIKSPAEFDKDDLDMNIRPAAGDKWQACANEEGLFDFNKEAKGQRGGLIHACAYVYSDAARKVQIWGGSTEAMEIFVNGKSVYRGERLAFTEPESSKVKDVSLAKGWNTVLVRISSLDHGFKLCLRIRDELGHEPPAGLWYSTEPPAKE